MSPEEKIERLIREAEEYLKQEARRRNIPLEAKGTIPAREDYFKNPEQSKARIVITFDKDGEKRYRIVTAN